jgi:hypothetical protein
MFFDDSSESIFPRRQQSGQALKVPEKAHPPPRAGAAFKLEATFADLRFSHVGLPFFGIARVSE